VSLAGDAICDLNSEGFDAELEFDPSLGASGYSMGDLVL